jgi:5-methylcytosine-specific restriction endonuclease McrA
MYEDKEYEEYNRKYWENEKENILKRKKRYYAEMELRQIRKNKRRAPKYRLNATISQAICVSLQGVKAGRHWEDLVGYTLEELIKHLKKTMPEGYHWEDYINGKLHVDHIIPKSAFNFTKAEHIDFQRCWALSNLRLLSAKKNRQKKDKLYKPFQPALKLET